MPASALDSPGSWPLRGWGRGQGPEAGQNTRPEQTGFPGRAPRDCSPPPLSPHQLTVPPHCPRRAPCRKALWGQPRALRAHRPPGRGSCPEQTPPPTACAVTVRRRRPLVAVSSQRGRGARVGLKPTKAGDRLPGWDGPPAACGSGSSPGPDASPAGASPAGAAWCDFRGTQVGKRGRDPARGRRAGPSSLTPSFTHSFVPPPGSPVGQARWGPVTEGPAGQGRGFVSVRRWHMPAECSPCRDRVRPVL